MTRITTYLSLLTLNVNELNSPIKRHHLANWIKKKIQQSVAYRKCISSTETRTSLGSKARRRFTKPMAPENRQEQQYLSQTK
jgi:hypothetical protein